MSEPAVRIFFFPPNVSSEKTSCITANPPSHPHYPYACSLTVGCSAGGSRMRRSERAPRLFAELQSNLKKKRKIHKSLRQLLRAVISKKYICLMLNQFHLQIRFFFPSVTAKLVAKFDYFCYISKSQ